MYLTGARGLAASVSSARERGKAAPSQQAGAILIERRMHGASGGDGRTVTVRLASTENQRNTASMLLNRMYDWRGYGSNHAVGNDEHSIAFTASSDGELAGTLTLTVDSATGLSIDKTFADELAVFRQMPGARICELTRLAFNPSPDSRPVLAALFHIIFMYGTHRYACTDLFIEVNPRHVRFYEAMLGFRRMGELRTNDAVGAPSQLMWLKVAEIRNYIRAHGGKDNRKGHSLYPYFFSREEEAGLYARIAHLADAEGAPAQEHRVGLIAAAGVC